MRKKKRRARRGLRLLLLLILLLAAAVCLENTRVRTVRYSLELPELPAAFEGLRILQISDLHGREGLTQQLLDAARKQAPELILLTGDLVDGEGQLEELTPLLTGLRSLAPVYYVTGNHEWALDIHRLLAGLEALGIEPLRNAFVRLERNGDSILLAGVDDPNGYADMKSPARLAAEMAEAGGGFSILLSHRPDRFREYAALGFDLVFSGHVHGGMLRLPFLGGVLAPGHVLFPEFDGGLFWEGDSCMVLSRGLAGVGGFPRVFNAIEMPVVELHRAG